MPPKKNLITRTCARCGRQERCVGGGIPAGWSFATEGKRVEYICPDCVRQNIRAIEAKLPEEYWER